MTDSPASPIGPARRVTLATPVHFALLVGLVSAATATLMLEIVDEIRFHDSAVLYSFAINIAICILALSWSTVRDAISLRLIFWYFNLLFFGIAALAIYLTGYWTFPVEESTVLKANLLILTSYLVYLGTYELGLRHAKRGSKPSPPLPPRVLSNRKLAVWSLVVMAGVASLVAAVGYSATGSMVLRAFGAVYSPTYLVAEFAARPTVFFLFLFALFNARYSRRIPVSRIVVLLTFATAMVMLGPFSSGRFLIFAFYFGLLVLWFPPSAGRRYFYLVLLFIGVFGSHLQDLVRGLIGGRADVYNAPFSAHYFYQGHFDAFENFCHSISFVAAEGIVWGRQFFGAVLFWVPREFWPEKPIGSAAFVATRFLANTFDVGDTNIASPLIEEAFLNLHIFGIVLVFGALGFGSARADRLFARYLGELKRARNVLPVAPADHSAALVLYPVVLGLSLFVLRGDFLSGFAYGTGIIVSFLIVNFLVGRKMPRSRVGAPRMPAAGSPSPAVADGGQI